MIIAQMNENITRRSIKMPPTEGKQCCINLNDYLQTE